MEARRHRAKTADAVNLLFNSNPSFAAGFVHQKRGLKSWRSRKENVLDVEPVVKVVETIVAIITVDQ